MASPVLDKNVSEQLAPIITAVADRIHYAEGRRTNYTVMAVALIAGGISVLVFALGSIGQLWLKYASLVISIGFIALGLLVLIVYGRQTNQYPYTSATKTWKWFYRDALPDRTAFALKWFERATTQKKRITEAYQNQLPQFKLDMARLQSEQISAEQDTEQLYSLHVNELYKNLYLSRLRTVFNAGLFLTVFIAIVAGIIGAYVERKETSLQSINVAGNGWSWKIEYQLLSAPLADNLDIAIHASVRNQRPTPLLIRGIALTNSIGWPLPVQIKFDRGFPSQIAPGMTANAYGSIRVSRDIWEHHQSFVVSIK